MPLLQIEWLQFMWVEKKKKKEGCIKRASSVSES